MNATRSTCKESMSPLGMAEPHFGWLAACADLARWQLRIVVADNATSVRVIIPVCGISKCCSGTQRQQASPPQSSSAAYSETTLKAYCDGATMQCSAQWLVSSFTTCSSTSGSSSRKMRSAGATTTNAAAGVKMWAAVEAKNQHLQALASQH